ncbi:hypothetical protein DASC09_012140 [Saccharomycopsis crataegensis]|uniref:Uncharacterized protein n=1 Tax=Saccharomycopsis crataegensis TaxID=43959 RepID=A0AAV5QGU6_9ASCO|nr:hypothetical protein DASC09_012140 [Saccharomycopsis crataegensis]
MSVDLDNSKESITVSLLADSIPVESSAASSGYDVGSTSSLNAGVETALKSKKITTMNIANDNKKNGNSEIKSTAKSESDFLSIDDLKSMKLMISEIPKISGNNSSLKKFKLEIEESINKLKSASLTTSNNFPTFDWEKIGKIYDEIFEDYGREMESIDMEFKELEHERSMWIKAALYIDDRKALQRIQQRAEWMDQKESQVNYNRQQLINSVGIIKNAICGLQTVEKK